VFLAAFWIIALRLAPFSSCQGQCLQCALSVFEVGEQYPPIFIGYSLCYSLKTLPAWSQFRMRVHHDGACFSVSLRAYSSPIDRLDLRTSTWTLYRILEARTKSQQGSALHKCNSPGSPSVNPRPLRDSLLITMSILPYHPRQAHQNVLKRSM